ncbi:MAG: 4Fe-4S dicluster domain-containing protein, partial [Candidatus Hadarchaeum sp.]
QCSYCTEFCPRYLLGYDVQPHRVMRSLGFSLAGTQLWNQWGQLCCACGLCTLYACPEDLYPKEACDKAKAELKAAGVRFVQQRPVQVHPMKEARRVPQAALRRRLQIERYETETPYDPIEYRPARVRLLLSQHAGQPAQPVVQAGERVRAGQPVADVPEDRLGVPVHASIDGVVTQVTEQFIEISAG